MILIAQIYVNDIIFNATNESPCQEFSKIIHGAFEMYMMGELNFFLGLQIKPRKNEIFISHTKYLKELLKKYGMHHANGADIPRTSTTLLDVEFKELISTLSNIEKQLTRYYI